MHEKWVIFLSLSLLSSESCCLYCCCCIQPIGGNFISHRVACLFYNSSRGFSMSEITFPRRSTKKTRSDSVESAGLP